MSTDAKDAQARAWDRARAEALTAMVREGEGAGMYADHGAAGFCTDHGQPALDVAAIRARAEDFRRLDEGPGVSAEVWALMSSMSARDVPAMLDALAGAEKTLTDLAPLSLLAERDALAATVARVEAVAEDLIGAPGSRRWGFKQEQTVRLVQADLRAVLGLTVTDTPTECGWCGGPQHDPGDCTVAQWAEAQRLCDADRWYEDGDV